MNATISGNGTIPIRRGLPSLTIDGPAASYASKHWTQRDYRMAQTFWDSLFDADATDPQPELQQFLAEAYGNRFLMFLAADSAASAAPLAVVLESVPIGCLGGTAMESTFDAAIPLLGPAATLSVTQNGQVSVTL